VGGTVLSPSSTPSLDSTASWITRAQAGDGLARDYLARRYVDNLRRWAHGRLPRGARDLSDTDDLVQSTLVQAFNRLRDFEPRREGAFLAYLRKILLNQIRDEIRKARRSPEKAGSSADLPAGGPSPMEDAIGRDLLGRYEQALTKLTEDEREAVILRVELGFRYKTIAEALDLPSANAARMAVVRALVRLGDQMGGEHGNR